MKLIDKDKIINEIKSYINNIEVSQKAGLIKKRDANLKIILYRNVLSFLDTLEVKEVKDVDLEKHLKEDIEDVFFDLNGVAVKGASYYITVEDVKDIAKHFFELGTKAIQKL